MNSHQPTLEKSHQVIGRLKEYSMEIGRPTRPAPRNPKKALKNICIISIIGICPLLAVNTNALGVI